MYSMRKNKSFIQPLLNWAFLYSRHVSTAMNKTKSLPSLSSGEELHIMYHVMMSILKKNKEG